MYFVSPNLKTCLRACLPPCYGGACEVY